MTEKYIDSICSSIVSYFGDGYTIYTDRVPQEFLTPCFFVSLSNTHRQERLGGRAILRCTVLLKFFPRETSQPSGECRSVMDKLQSLLKFIVVDGKTIPGFLLNGKMEESESTLSFSVVYDIFVNQGEEIEKMIDLKLESQRLKSIGQKMELPIIT